MKPKRRQGEGILRHHQMKALSKGGGKQVHPKIPTREELWREEGAVDSKGPIDVQLSQLDIN